MQKAPTRNLYRSRISRAAAGSKTPTVRVLSFPKTSLSNYTLRSQRESTLTITADARGLGAFCFGKLLMYDAVFRRSVVSGWSEIWPRENGSLTGDGTI